MITGTGSNLGWTGLQQPVPVYKLGFGGGPVKARPLHLLVHAIARVSADWLGFARAFSGKCQEGVKLCQTELQYPLDNPRSGTGSGPNRESVGTRPASGH